MSHLEMCMFHKVSPLNCQVIILPWCLLLYIYIISRWGEVRWGEVRWGEVRWGEVRWGEVRWGEVRWGEVRCKCHIVWNSPNNNQYIYIYRGRCKAVKWLADIGSQCIGTPVLWASSARMGASCCHVNRYQNVPGPDSEIWLWKCRMGR